MRIFKNKSFGKFANKEGITDVKLCKVIKEISDGKIDADYGGGVIKQRIARPREGTSGGYRSIILFRKDEKAFFVYGYSKKTRENINDAEEKAFKKLAAETFRYTDQQIKKLIEDGIYKEVKNNDEI